VLAVAARVAVALDVEEGETLTAPAGGELLRRIGCRPAPGSAHLESSFWWIPCFTTKE